MLIYYFMIGWRNLRRNPVLTTLMVLTLAIGVASSISTLTILHMMSGDPIPGKSARLLVPLLDNGPVEGYTPGEEIDDAQMSYRDVSNLLASNQGERRTALFNVAAAVEPQRADLPVLRAGGTAPTHDFFAMFEVPMRYGQAWGEAEDRSGADVVVLSRALSETLYGNDNPVGRRVRMFERDFQIVGVSDTWQPQPHFHHLIGNNTFGGGDEFFIPLRSAIRHELEHEGNMNCPGDRTPGFQGLLDSECTWIQFWFESSGADGRAALRNYLDSYTAEQARLGRFKRHNPNRLFDVMEWMDYLKVVGNDQHLAVWLSLGFLVLCLINTVGLLLAKLSTRAGEVGVRRALGASRRDIFRQFLVETGLIGLGGGLLGLLLTWLTLHLIAGQSEKMAVVAQLDWTMLLATFALALGSALLAGILPTWRACQVTPAIQLKSQ
jgi:putative ABC transport system permease protein